MQYFTPADDGYKSRFLQVRDRLDFDPTNKVHLAAAKKFITEGKWDLLFKAEWPYVTVPATVLHKIALYTCQKELS